MESCLDGSDVSDNELMGDPVDCSDGPLQSGVGSDHIVITIKSVSHPSESPIDSYHQPSL